MTACRSCKAEVVWCVTPQGKRMPVDAMPTAEGNVCVSECPETGADLCRVLSAAERAERALEGAAE